MSLDINVTTNGADQHRADCVVVACHESRALSPAAERVDRASSGALARLLKSTAFEGKPGQTFFCNLEGVAADRVLVVGAGAKGALPASRFRRVVSSAADAATAGGARSVGWYLGEIEVEERDAYWHARQAVEAFGDATYRFESMKSAANRGKPPALRTVRLGVDTKAERREVTRGIEHGLALAAGLALAKDLGNLPGNVCTPSHLADEARKLARRHPAVSARVRGEADIKRLGMGTFLSVARGSREPPRLITIEYKGGKRGHKPIALVGKGVTFDSGGISLKPAATMDEMKYDMCGAASVIGTIEAVASMKLPINVVGVIPATENLPGGNATKPGDVVTSMSGQTVEILNTDAEGRLILCDALTYCARYRPETVIDIATLTGACVIALGAHASGLFANDDALADALLAAGERSGDRAWRMPVWDEYGEALKSNFADVANVGGREAGAVTAACFLARFAKDLRWAHLDIAGSAWRGGKDKGSTGRPVRLLTQYLLDQAGGADSPRAAS
ncbi:MAG: leucyl aminopeptidase [Ectothiorhodospiraceae bacterium]|nr:leucyl aminopeptidase [Chromatiales bacterium]MCP5154998.1 leucyl aminopeptidase [Ectothiorhodospiraceae bacterium]